MLCYLAAIRSGTDRDKFTQVYERCRYTMLYVARGVLAGKYAYLAEDAVHEAFLKLADHMEMVDDPASARTRSLAVIMAKHKAVDILRREQKLSKVPLEESGLTDSAARDETEGYADLSALKEALSTLSEDYRTVLELKYVLGYGSREIAVLLDTNQKNIDMRVYRAKKKLRCILQEK